MKKLTLSQIGLYNPQRLSDEVMESLFVIRRKTFDFIISKIQDEPAGSIPQHYLIIGQRGMGKTTLLKRLEVELRKETYKSRFIPLLLPEEQYNLKNLAEFWLNCLDALADTLETEKQATEVKKLDTKIKELQGIKENDELAGQAYAYFKSVCIHLGRRPVLLIDNMSFIFDRFNKADQHKLRGILMQNGAPVLVGASAVAMDDTYDYGAPFYDAFQTYYLSKINFNELLDILTNLARLTGSDEVIRDIHKENGRLKALHLLTGGNPRTAVMLFRLIVKGFSPEINDDLEALLDEITPLYKARFEELSTQMQVIVDAVALHWDPIVLEELRTETRYENHQLSPQLKRLEELGWIERLEAYQAKGKAYQISERFFNIWFLMRRSSRRQKRELYCLSKFLETFYGDDLESIAQKRLDIPSKSIDHVTYNLAMAEAVRDRNLKNALQNRSYTALREHAKENPRLLESFAIPQGRNAALDEEERLREAIAKDNDNSLLWERLGYLYHFNLKDLTKAEQAYIKAIDLGSSNRSLWNVLGDLYQYDLENYTAAENAYKKAIGKDSKSVYSWTALGDLYHYHLGKYIEAENAYKKVIELNSEYVYPWNCLGDLYQYCLGKYEEAKSSYEKAIELDSRDAYPWNGLGNLYQYSLGKFEKAKSSYEKAFELNSEDAYPLNGLGNLYHYHLGRYLEAENIYKKAAELDSNFATPWNGLGNLYLDYFGEYLQAKLAYEKAIEINNDISAWYNLVFLYRDKLNEYQKAKETFKNLEEDSRIADSYWLNQVIFDLYDKNEGIAKENLQKAFNRIENQLPLNTQDDWWRFGAVVHKLGYSNWFTELLKEQGLETVIAPYYIALKAMMAKDPEAFIKSKAVEFREPSKKLMEIMLNYIA